MTTDDQLIWRESLRNGYVLAQIYYAWSQSGVLDALREVRSPGASCTELAAAAGCDEQVLDPTLYYVAYADRVLERSHGRYALTEFGRRAFNSGIENSLTAFVGAYGCVLEELLPTLLGDKRYGIDFERRGDLLARASQTATRGNFPFIVDRMRAHGVRCVVDLGCGAAGVLREFCALDDDLYGIGLDVSEQAIEEARRNAASANLGGRTEFLVGDLADVDGWSVQLGREVDAFHCTGVLHELLRDGEEAVVRIMARIRDAFPGRLFFLGEFDGRTEDDYRALDEPLVRVKDLWYQDLVHPLTHQGKPQPRKVWLRLLQRAGVEVLEVAPFRHNVYVLRL